MCILYHFRIKPLLFITISTYNLSTQRVCKLCLHNLSDDKTRVLCLYYCTKQFKPLLHFSIKNVLHHLLGGSDLNGVSMVDNNGETHCNFSGCP